MMKTGLYFSNGVLRLRSRVEEGSVTEKELEMQRKVPSTLIPLDGL